MKKIILVSAAFACLAAAAVVLNANFATGLIEIEPAISRLVQTKPITVRTKSYPRPPYSGATYYIYERDDKVICTKVETCNKFEQCSSEYKKGEWKDQMDVDYDEPYNITKPVAIAANKLKKHACLTKFKLLP